jgi:hypothetical protein
MRPGDPPFLTSMRDTALVARFELIRAVRTWQALAVVVLYLVATGGAARLFVAILSEIENSAAQQLGVPPTDYPGAMIGEIVKSGELHHMLGAMVGDERLVDALLGWPVLAIFHLWVGIVLMPFLATFSSAESVSADLRSRALRFELLRTGRVELAAGRFVGQALLIGLASVLAAGSTWVVGMAYMVGNDPIDLAFALIWLGLRAWGFSLPFIGIGLGCSQWTSSPAWARVLAVVASAATWVIYGMSFTPVVIQFPIVSGILQQSLPQGWIRLLWQPDASWVLATGIFGAFGLVFVAVGLIGLTWRDV